ncbi:MAG: SUMF1/EgtB/PvdO family nonheme iron enzyme [Thermoguttaceae bacterium]|nr:SUMF1/EgtB/PvdO family nonheme iron enzyme [Thermoguttaceae bacterium]
MRRIVTLLFFVVIACLSQTSEARKLALLVGVDDYVNASSLKCCVNDMKALKTALINIGFMESDIFILTTGSSVRDLPIKENIEQKVAEILAAARTGDLVFLAFSGHGAREGYTDYFCPPFAKTNDLEGTCVSITKVMDDLSKCKASFKWMVVDACRDDPNNSRDAKAFQVISTPPQGVALFQSCNKDEKSYEEKRVGGNGYFTKNLVAALSGEADSNHDGKLTLLEVCAWTAAQTQAEVEQAENKTQRPYLNLSAANFTLTEDLNVLKAGFLVDEARKAVEEEKYELAVKKYDEAIDLFPRSKSIKRERDVASRMLNMSQTPRVVTPPELSSAPRLDTPGSIAGERRTITINGIEFAFRWCPPGTFMMGSPESEKDRYDNEKQHQVTLTKGFWMLETEVTVGMFKAFVIDSGYQSERWEPFGWIGNIGEQNSKDPVPFVGISDNVNDPITLVSWDDSMAFCKWLSKKIGQDITLPTEAQWEYACRAGTTGAYAGNLDEMAWYNTLNTSFFSCVGAKKHNAWGLYDMHGNVDEWCQDWLADYPSRSVTDPVGPSKGSSRVFRGGSYTATREECRSAYRGSFSPETQGGNTVGFRCVIVNLHPSTVLVEAPTGTPKAGDRMVYKVDGMEYAFRYCSPGTFTMGSPTRELGREDDEMQYEVTLTKGFWMMETEVTVGMFKAFVNDTGYESRGDTPFGWAGSSWEQNSRHSWRNPGFNQDDSHPVTCVSWDDAMAFCKWLSNRIGQEITLPTEAQWEYACRARTTGAYAGNLDEMAWYNGKSGTHQIKSKTPNNWGIYDMHGNVWEWCQDRYSEYPDESVADPIAPSYTFFNVIRGGSWGSSAKNCRSAIRHCNAPVSRSYDLGFRCVNIEPRPLTPSTSVVSATLIEAPSGTPKVGDRMVYKLNGVEFAFRYCPPGTFMMGSQESDGGRRDSEETQHQVTLTKGFWMMETEVTVGLFKEFVNDTGYDTKGEIPHGWTGSTFEMSLKYSWHNPGFSQVDSHPVTCVSWNDAVAFCKWLSKKTGQEITLPTEAQWEYACRAETTGAYAGNLNEMAWYDSNSGDKTHPVGTKKPNAWGLYDMHGNVWEWCQDWKAYYQSESASDPTGPSIGAFRVFRGGGWSLDADFCRSAFRHGFYPGDRRCDLGFRCVNVELRPLTPSTSVQQPPVPPSTPVQQPTEAPKASDRMVYKVDGVEFAFRYCPPGTFMMGSPKSEDERRDSEETQHQVTLTKGFWMMETEVTVGMFKAFVSDTDYESKGDTPYGWTGSAAEQNSKYSWRNPGFSQDDSHPVTCISWNDAVAFCKWLSAKTGQEITLPTEAQWEYACRAGVSDVFSGKLTEMAWFYGKSGTHQVKSKTANNWGLYDMHGNVWEWCLDWKAYYQSERVSDPTGPSTGSLRVYRGGGWISDYGGCRSARRGGRSPGGRDYDLGFRCVKGQ